MQSEKVDLLVKALIKAKADFGPVEKNKENPFFKSKYADLGTIDQAVTPALHKNGLTVVQTTEIAGIQPVLVTTLFHESGQFLSGQYPLNPVKADPQGLGSATTYARRYALCAMLTIVADDDDDGNAASTPQKSAPTQAAQAKTSEGTARPVISEAQGRRLYALWKAANRQDSEVKEHIKAKYGLNTTKDIPRDVYEEICKWVESSEPPASDVDETF